MTTPIAQGPVDVNVSRQRCEYCDDTGDVTALDGEYRGPCSCGAPSMFQAEMEALERDQGPQMVTVTREMAMDAGCPEMEGAQVQW